MRGRAARTRTAVRRLAVAVVTTGLLTATAAVPAPASATPSGSPAATAVSRFLAGSLPAGSVDLDRLVALDGVTATAPAATAPATVRTIAGPLGPASLGGLTATLPGGLHLPLTQFVRLGAVNQFAQAAADGSARAAAGAVADSGAVDTGPGSAFPADASIDLAGLLGPARAVLTRAALSLGGVTAVAALDSRRAGAPAARCADLSRPEHCRGYSVARGRLELAAPAVTALVRSVGTALGAAASTLDSSLRSALAATVLRSVTGLLSTLDRVVGGLGVLSNSLAVSVSTDLRSALAPVLRGTLSDGVVSLDLTTGAISVDLAALGAGLDGLGPSTPVLGAAALSAVVGRLGDLLDGLVRRIGGAVSTALDAAAVGLGGGICLLRALGSCVAGLSVRCSGTLAGLVSGTAPLTVGGTGLLTLGGPTLATVVSAVRSALAATAGPLSATARSGVTAAAGQAAAALGSALDPALRAVGSVVRATANVQEPGASPGAVREVALRLSVGGPAGGAASVDLARVEVSARPPSAASTPPGGPGPGSVATTARPVPGRTVVVPGRPGSSVVLPAVPGGGSPSTAGAAQEVPFPGAPAPQAEGHRGSGLPWTALGALLLALAALIAAVASRRLRKDQRKDQRRDRRGDPRRSV